MKNYLSCSSLWIIIAMILSACQPKETKNMIQRELKSNWKYHQVNGRLQGIASVPGTIHTDLLQNKQIDDPFYRVNEKKLQWIDKEDWEYSTSLNLTKEELSRQNLMLDCKGLDTYADVYFNDSLVLKADNMFREWEIDIKKLARLGENRLRIYFHSPIKMGLELLSKSKIAYPASNDQSENGGLGNKKVSIFTRKAAYHYGWDWGPRFVTSGIWRPIYLKAWNQVRINDVFIHQNQIDENLAVLQAEVSVVANESGKGKIVLADKNTGEEFLSQTITISKGENRYVLPFQIKNPKLWWSSGLGEANRYGFDVRLITKGKLMAHQEVNTGLRSLKLLREKDSIGESFYFELNGVKVFAKGANYIPNDNFLPRVTSEDYQKVIADAKNANMNMLRVWGGGIYENDEFYELCDQNGIMVWQDFMFACSMYPGNEEFLENVKKEAEDNIIRLRNHPSIALWCGNNEMNTAWHYYSKGGWGWKERYTPEQGAKMQQAYLDIFHGILPKAVEKLTDGDDYWPSSPQAGFEPQKHSDYSSTSGDMHYWGVWHGKHPFGDFEKYKARFMSEYGFQSFPDFETVKTYAEPQDYNIESEVMAAHQRSGIGNLRIKEYMSWDYNLPDNFQEFLYLSQVLQARGIKAAIEAHRRAMPYCMGTLYWQINDCWPVASWSSTDYFHKWKAMHYIARKAYRPVLLSAVSKNQELEIYGVSDLLENQPGQLSLILMNFEGKKLMQKDLNVVLKKNTSALLLRLPILDFLKNQNKNEVVLSMALKQKDKVLADNKYYFAKPKNLHLPKANIEVKIQNVDGNKYVEVSSKKLVRDLYLNFENSDLQFSDNYFDLLPGESKTLELTGKDIPDQSKLRIRHL